MPELATLPRSGSGSFPGGIHPRDHKALSAGQAITVLTTPDAVRIPLVQHIGASAKPLTKPRQAVTAGELIAEAGGFVSVPMHAPLAGKAGKLEPVTLANGRHVQAIPIVVEGDQLQGQALYDDHFAGPWELTSVTPEAIRQRIQAAGLVGQGGAAFPTHVKFAPNKDKPTDTVLINGCECEPFLTADDRVMREAPSAVIAGALLAGAAAGATNLVIAVEANKPEALVALRAAVQGKAIRIAELKTRYPMGGEKQTVRAAIGRTIPTGGLPLDVGVVVINVGSAVAIARAVLRQKPLTHRVVTVTGPGVRAPKNILAPIGVALSALIDFCGGLSPDAARVIAGGPMMGFTVGSLEVPLTKGTSGITVLRSQDLPEVLRTNCVRCGRCAEVCPLDLVASRLALAAQHENWDMARRYAITACMECGCCAYACPARIPLVQLIRVGKARLPKD